MVGADNYSVEIREHWEPDYSGTIISNGSGSTIVEQVKGSHANLEKLPLADQKHNATEGVKKIQIDTERADLHFMDEGQPTAEEKTIMIDALKYFTSEITREKLEQLKIYAEYCYAAEHGYRFIDVADSKYWTGL